MIFKEIKAKKTYSRLILLIAALMLAMVFIPVHAQAASAVKTKKVTMRVGQKVQLKLKGVDEKLKWKSLNKKKVSVKSTGLITAKKKGKTTVRVNYDGVTYKFNVTVKKRKKGQKNTVKTVTVALKNVSTSFASSEESSSSEKETFTPAKYAGLKTIVDEKLKFQPKNIVMIGDSRFVGMKNAVGGKATWYCKISMGLSWLQETVNIPKLIKQKKLDVDGKAIVFNLGVNDLGNVNNYISYLNSLGETLRKKGATVYFMTVNPINDKLASEKNYKVRNKTVISFNKKMCAGLKGFGIIDTYDELVFQSFTTVDGVHYDASTYRTIYSYMLKCIGA